MLLYGSHDTKWSDHSNHFEAVEEGALEEMRLRLVDDAKRVMIANQAQKAMGKAMGETWTAGDFTFFPPCFSSRK